MIMMRVGGGCMIKLYAQPEGENEFLIWSNGYSAVMGYKLRLIGLVTMPNLIFDRFSKIRNATKLRFIIKAKSYHGTCKINGSNAIISGYLFNLAHQ